LAKPSAGSVKTVTFGGRKSAAPYFRFAWGSPEALAAFPVFEQVPSTIVPDVEVLQDLNASDSTFAAVAAYQGAIVRIELDGGAITKGSILGDALSTPLVIGDVVLAQSHVANSSGWAREVIVKPDGSVAVFREVANTNVTNFATDGTNLYWQEAHGGASYTSAQPDGEVWYAPLTTDPTTLASTAKVLVPTVSNGAPSQAVAFGGFYAVQNVWDGYWVVRASDGATKMVPATPNRRIHYLGYVSSASEIWFVEDGPIAIQSGIALVRVQYGTWP
jgi:hypothetical protein